jgi:DNA polymerase III delta prime subunit
METGIVSETKYGRVRKMQIETSVFATSNNLQKIIEPIRSRFFVLTLQAYTYEQFYDIALGLLTSDKHKIDEEIAKATIDVVWNTSKNILDSLRLGRLSRSVEDVKWLANSFFR